MILGSGKMQAGDGYTHIWAAKMWDRWRDLEREAEIGAWGGFLYSTLMIIREGSQGRGSPHWSAAGVCVPESWCISLGGFSQTVVLHLIEKGYSLSWISQLGRRRAEAQTQAWTSPSPNMLFQKRGLFSF